MSQERKRILEMVQEGKLSAQEAIILLDALDGKSDVKASTQDSETTSTQVKKTTQEEASTGKQKKTKKKSEKKDSVSFYSQLESAGERIFDFVNNAFKKIKDIDLQFNQSLDVDRKSTRLNSSHVKISYAVFCLKKKKKKTVNINCKENRRI